MPWFPPTQTVADPLPVQTLLVRAGDRLPSFAARVEDEFGVAVDLTASRCYLVLRPMTAGVTVPDSLVNVELTIEDAATGYVSLDWQYEQTSQVTAGLYDVLVRIEYDNGDVTVAPTGDMFATIYFASAIDGGYFAKEADGTFTRDGDAFVVAT